MYAAQHCAALCDSVWHSTARRGTASHPLRPHTPFKSEDNLCHCIAAFQHHPHCLQRCSPTVKTLECLCPTTLDHGSHVVGDIRDDGRQEKLVQQHNRMLLRAHMRETHPPAPSTSNKLQETNL